MKKQKKKIWIGILVGAITTSLILGTIFVVFVFKLFAGEKTIITDISRYEEALRTYSDNVEYHTGLMTFPETIPDSATDIDFYSFDHSSIVGNTGEIFLQCTYSETDYQAEMERLENTYKRYGSVEKRLLYDEESFAYPAYIAINGHSSNYEYALLTGERQITYIYASYVAEDGTEEIKQEYLPLEPKNTYSQTQEELRENYSIYLVREYAYPDGSLSREYNQTRDAIVMVEKHHYERIGYNLFYVNTYLDETDTEIIKDCSFVYNTSKHDSIFELPEEILYTELKGYRFKSLELNEDKTMAYVTYYDGEEEKTREYEIPEIRGEKR